MADEINIEPMQDNIGNYSYSIDRLRIILMFFMCLNLLGSPIELGGFADIINGFVPIAFYIISGYLVLRESDDRSKRIVRTIKRSAITFGVLAVVYFAINFFYYLWRGINILTVFSSKRFWFNFIVLNLWQFDIGSAIWYVQALLYAYIIIYFLNKLKLLKFDWIFATVLIIFAVITGELCGIIKWNILGYNYLPGNFLTRALPYTLLGGFMNRKIDYLRKVNIVFYIFGIAIGIFLINTEVGIFGTLNVASYTAHLIGMPVIAFSVCMLSFKDQNSEPGFEEYLGMSRWHTNCIYYLSQPVSFVLLIIMSHLSYAVIVELMGLLGMITFFICFSVAWLISYISRKLFVRKAVISDNSTISPIDDSQKKSR